MSNFPSGVVTTSQVQKGHPNYSASIAVKGKIESTGVGDDLRLNAKYFLTLPGIIKIVQIILAVICMVSISPPLTWYSRLFTTVVAVSFALTVILCFCYFVTLRNVVFPNSNWTFGELVYTFSVTLLLLITSIIQLSITCRSDYRISLQYYGYFVAYIIAGVFGLLNFLAYGAGGYFLYLEWKETRGTSSVRPMNGHNYA